MGARKRNAGNMSGRGYVQPGRGTLGMKVGSWALMRVTPQVATSCNLRWNRPVTPEVPLVVAVVVVVVIVGGAFEGTAGDDVDGNHEPKYDCPEPRYVWPFSFQRVV